MKHEYTVYKTKQGLFFIHYNGKFIGNRSTENQVMACITAHSVLKDLRQDTIKIIRVDGVPPEYPNGILD